MFKEIVYSIFGFIATMGSVFGVYTAITEQCTLANITLGITVTILWIMLVIKNRG